VWTIPGDAMKGRRDATSHFRVPLSKEALAVIDAARPFGRNGYLFPSVRKGVISDATMSGFMERRGDGRASLSSTARAILVCLSQTR
jgi:integrase